METHSQSIRVLVRPPPPPPPPPAPTHPLPPQPATPPKSGVVVVGFIGMRHHDVAHLINKIIDSHAFGSGNLDTPFRIDSEKIDAEMREWFESRNLSFYHDEDQGILYLQLSVANCIVADEVSPEGRLGFESGLEDRELGDLKGLIFMFSVCHIIILMQEGSRFDTQLLKKFRVLQAAKHAMVPFIRSQNISSVPSRPHSSAQFQIPVSGVSFNNASPGKTQGTHNRNASTNAAVSGLGSHTSLLPGQCTPVLLFVFVDDFSEIHNSGNNEQPPDTSLNVSSSLHGPARPGMPTKGSSSVVVLARPANKSEGGMRRKLQSSLEAQIRFLIKKCRTLSVSESSHAGSRSGAIASLAPLFSLDASKAVSLVDACSSQSGESLEFAIGLVAQVLDGKATPDSLLLESHLQHTNKEDILSVKEFIQRQSVFLRGRGGSVGNGGSGSAGVGMVAAAAAAAAASTSSSTSTSASSGKSIAPPDLPTLEIWSTSSQLILLRILSAKPVCGYEAKPNGVQEQNAMTVTGETTSTSDPYKSAISHLENGIGMNTRFSTLWCEKAFPVAKAVYLEDLPPCYPSYQHEDHLKKALHSLMSMVKGPALQLYKKKLEDECMSIWCSGRQLCDAVSLTGKSCMHQKHDTIALSTDDITHHSSGFVYLHACACGRSRQLRPDPFDFEAANVTCHTFVDCDKLLPSVKLPEGIVKGPIQHSSWNLIRVGGARYYDPVKGLIQSGFCATQKFLSRWTIVLEKPPLNGIQQGSSDRNIRSEIAEDTGSQTADAVQLGAERTQNGVGTLKKLSSDITGNNSKNLSIGGGFPNILMRKPFAEVVAGPAAANSGFPPLFSRKQLTQDAEKGVKLHNGRQIGLDKLGDIVHSQESHKVEKAGPVDDSRHNGNAGIVSKYGDSFPHIGSNIASSNVNDGEQIKVISSVKAVTIFVGFEYECPHGHRFILTLDHLSDLGLSCSAPEENVLPLPVETTDKKQDPGKLGKIGGHGRSRRQPHGMLMGKAKNLEKSKEKVANGNIPSNKKSMHPARHGKSQNERTEAVNPVEDLDSGGAFSLLNKNLPLYMKCPHCRESRTKIGASNVKYASNISQLQRIFVVTPSTPIVLAMNPVIQFELSCLPPSIPDREQKLQFSLGCPVILPPDSFLSLRLPFVYGVALEDGVHSLKPFENQPHLTAYITRGTALQVMSNQSTLNPESVTWLMPENFPAS